MLRDKTHRRIVPRWRPSSSAPSSSDFAVLKKPVARSTQSPDLAGTALRAFAEDRSIGTASEALAEALLTRDEGAARDAATYILQNASEAPAPLVRMARENSGGSLVQVSTPFVDVARARALLKLSPRNAAIWADMARHYASEGNKHQALRCMNTALQLAPDHRWMLRTASRFLVHQQDYAAAHRLLANHPRTKNDPWLMAAELACAHVAGKAPKFWKAGNDALRYDRFSSTHISELATAIGMMELESGNRKQAKKLVQRGLLSPTENTLAQVIWAKESKHLGDGLPKLDSLVGARGDAFEAAYKLRLRRGDVQDALTACQRWMADEPFAARPKLESTYVASLLDDYAMIFRTAKAALKTDGRLSVGMELNLMFAEISAGRIDARDPGQLLKALSRLKTLREIGGPVAVHAHANLALLSYRSGNPTMGREMYREAIEMARKIDGSESAALAATFAAREAILTGAEDGPAQLASAIELAQRAGSEPCLFYTRKLQALAIEPERASQILSPSSASGFLKPVKILNISKDPQGFVLTIGRS